MSVSIRVFPDLLETCLFLGGARVKGLMSLAVTTFDGPTKLVSGATGAQVSATCASAGGGESYCDLGTTDGLGTTVGSTDELASDAQVPVTGAGTSAQLLSGIHCTSRQFTF